MFRIIDQLLNKVTMYRLVLYYLTLLTLTSIVLSFFNFFNFTSFNFHLSILIIFTTCFYTNKIFARTYKVSANVESVYITALILILIITPPDFENAIYDFMFLFWISVWSMASKYIFTFHKKHIINPVAFAAVLLLLALDEPVTWWVGNAYLFPIVLIGGIFIAKKIRHLDLIFSFLITVISITIISIFATGEPLIGGMVQLVAYSPLLFFTFIMLTEPLTMPPTKMKRIIYASLVGCLFTPLAPISSFYLAPELALLVGNIYSFIVSPKGRYFFRLKERKQLSPSTYEFSFETDDKYNFKPGQYLEWTLKHKNPDSRGNRRYLTISSSPTEQETKMGVKFYPNSSTYKQTLLKMSPGDQISGSQLAGDFVLPDNPKQKLVFIAGGIGVTPFRSMVKYLVDKQEKRSITMFYANNTVQDIVYDEIFNQAESLGIKTVYSVTRTEDLPDSWVGCRECISRQLITKEVPDYIERTFYISGPPAMVSAMVEILHDMDIPGNKIKTDFFPGLV